MYTLTKFVQNLSFFVQMCIILTSFVYLQCKLALQVQSKHIKILKKQKTKKQKQKQSSDQLAYLKEKKKKKKTLGTIEINVKML